MCLLSRRGGGEKSDQSPRQWNVLLLFLSVLFGNCVYVSTVPSFKEKEETFIFIVRDVKDRQICHICCVSDVYLLLEKCMMSDGMTDCVPESLQRRTERKEEVIRPQSQKSQRGHWCNLSGLHFPSIHELSGSHALCLNLTHYFRSTMIYRKYIWSSVNVHKITRFIWLL